MTAAQLTLGLVIADLLADALGMVGASIETHGEFAAVVAHQVTNVVMSNLSFALVRSPLWFVGSALAIALGRHLHRVHRGSGSLNFDTPRSRSVTR